MVQFGNHARRAGLVVLSAFGIALAAAAAAAMVLPRMIPADQMRRAAAEALAGSTRQTAVIPGVPTLAILPTPRVHLGRVSFPLPDGQSLDAEDVVAGLDFWSLLSRRAEVTAVTVVRPTLVLTGEGVAPALAFAPVLADGERPELRIAGGTIAWRSENGLTRELVSGLDADLDRVAKRRGVALTAAFDWRGQRVTSSLLLENAGDFLSGTLTPARLVVASGTAHARFQGKAAAGATPALDGRLNCEAGSLRDLFDWAGLALPGRGGFGPFELAGMLTADAAGASLTDAALDLDGNHGDGGLLVKFAEGRPLVQGTIAADRLDLSPYGGLRLTGESGRDWNRSAIDIGFLRALDIDLRLSAARVAVEHALFTGVAASAVVTDGRLVLSVGEARGWGGLLQASLALAPATDGRSGTSGAEVRIEAEGTDLDLARALDDLAGVRRIEGTGSLQIDIEGRGRSVQDIARSLSGAASLSGADGHLAGMDVAQMLQRVQRRPLSALNEQRGGRTAFTHLTGGIAIADGVGAVEDLVIEGRQVRVTLEGDVSIADRTFDLSGHAALLSARQEGAAAGPSALPFTVRGPWDAPIVMADALSLIERSDAAQSLIEAVKNRVMPLPRPALNAVGPAAPAN